MDLRRRQDLAENKLILMYALRKLGLKATVPVLSDLLAGREWINYFDMMEHLLELTESGFVKAEDNENYMLTGEGVSALYLYKKRIPFSIRSQIDEYARDHSDQIARQAEIHADFSQDSQNEFPVRLSISENGIEIFCLNLVSPTRQEAKTICVRFEAEAPQIYAGLIHRLTRDENNEKKEPSPNGNGSSDTD